MEDPGFHTYVEQPSDFQQKFRLADEMMSILHQCWNMEPEKRPSVRDLTEMVKAIDVLSFDDHCTSDVKESDEEEVDRRNRVLYVLDSDAHDESSSTSSDQDIVIFDQVASPIDERTINTIDVLEAKDELLSTAYNDLANSQASPIQEDGDPLDTTFTEVHSDLAHLKPVPVTMSSDIRMPSVWLKQSLQWMRRSNSTMVQRVSSPLHVYEQQFHLRRILT